MSREQWAFCTMLRFRPVGLRSSVFVFGSLLFDTSQNSIIRKIFTVPFLKYKRTKLKLRVFLAGHSVAMVTYCVTKIVPTCSPVIEQFFDTMIVASIDKSGYNDPSKSKSWNVLETVLSHLKEGNSSIP